MKAANSEWMAYNDLKEDDISHEYFKKEHFMGTAMICDRMGRIVLLLPQEEYQRFLQRVREKFGNIYASSVNGAVEEAVKSWMEEK